MKGIIRNADTKECIKDVSRLEHGDSITESPELGQNETHFRGVMQRECL